MFRPVLGRVRVHPHAAHRVLYAMLGVVAIGASTVLMTMLLVCMMLMLVITVRDGRLGHDLERLNRCSKNLRRP